MLVVLIAALSGPARASLTAVDQRLRIQDAWELFGPELVADWPGHTAEWYLPQRFRDVADTAALRRQRDQLLADAEVVCITFPPPKRLVMRAPHLRFVHQLPAGVSNLTRSDVWGSSVPVTSGRGAGSTVPIAEWAVAGMLALLKDFPRAFSQRSRGELDRRAFRGRQVAGKTLGVIGLGGIGREVARLGHALGMRVVGTRRSEAPVEHVETLYRPSQLHEVLRQSDVVVVAAQLTAETHHLLDQPAFAALKAGALVINVARGELIDESAMIDALRSGQVGGVALDVYEGEFDHPPPPELLAFDNVIFTPHTSGHTEQPLAGALGIFRENLR
ncbi:MAG TPA: NAD(P)-dependent oxidoreductase, partial [Chloroflexota bacterium]|nr:NAD(P)-dependent oxidoreductase [Chloroflexota bacterium]